MIIYYIHTSILIIWKLSVFAFSLFACIQVRPIQTVLFVYFHHYFDTHTPRLSFLHPHFHKHIHTYIIQSSVCVCARVHAHTHACGCKIACWPMRSFLTPKVRQINWGFRKSNFGCTSESQTNKLHVCIKKAFSKWYVTGVTYSLPMQTYRIWVIPTYITHSDYVHVQRCIQF